MSTRWPGGIISGTAPVPTGGGAQDTAPGVWTLEQADQYIATGEWPGTGTPDPQFQYVTTLLHGDGTNAGQNNTFLDSSSNNFTITRNGNTTQGSFSPYGTLWSNYQEAIGSYLSFATGSGSNFQFTGDFTIEAWVNHSALSTDTSMYVCSDGSNYLALNIDMANGNYNIYLNNSSPTAITSGISVGQWTHVAMVRSGSTITLYTNGVSKGTITNSSTLGYASPSINRNGGGNPSYTTPRYMSNFRIVKGTAVYTSAFTPPTTSLTAISGTSILTCQSNRFVDNSSNAYALTITGSPSVQRFSPFQSLATYTTARVGGSGYFDGTGDYLTVPNNSALQLGSSDFTIGAWVYVTATSGSAQTLIAKGTGSGNQASYVIQLNSSGTWVYNISDNGATWSFADVPIGTNTLNTWQYIALVRSGNTFTPYLNGVAGTTTTSSLTLFAGTAVLSLGADDAGTNRLTGYISDARVIKGTAIVPSTNPTAPLTPITNTQFLANFTNAAIFDSDASNNFETAGNAQISTSVVKYGTGSMAFDGTGDYLLAPSANQNFSLGATFTVEFWIYNTKTSGFGGVIGHTGTNWYTGIPITYVGGGASTFSMNSYAGSLTVSGLSNNTWYHVAIVSVNNSASMYINGTRVSGPLSQAVTGTPAYLTIGKHDGTNSIADFSGYIDDLRITKGYARYWYNFQPPTRAFPNYGGTLPAPTEDDLFEYNTLLLNGDGTNGGQNNTFVDSSTNNFTITRNGNTTQGSFSPYGSLWSNYFPAGGNYPLTTPQSTNTDLGSGNFTIECWAYATSFGSYYNMLGCKWEYPNKEWFLYYTASAITVGLSTDGLNDSAFFTASANIQLNTWYHIAASRSGSNLYIFLNGQLISTQTITQTFYTANQLVSIGNFPYSGISDTGMRGYISNFRLVKGTALYTSSFTPSTTPLTAVSGTQLLTCQSSRYLDNSSNNFTVTPTSSNSVQRFSPFEPSAPYSTSVIGGSGYFGGSGNYLTVPDNSALEIGSSNFTAECWYYPTSFATFAMVFNKWTSANTDRSWCIYVDTSGIPSGYITSGASDIGAVSSIALKLNTWNHLAYVRNGSTFTIYVNGVSGGTTTSSSSANNSTIGTSVGAEGFNSGNNYSNGYIADCRLTIGSALYTATFTPPTSPLTTTVSSGTVQLLTNMTNAAIPDYAMQNNLETVGNAQISTSVVKYGTGSLAFDGTGDYLRTPATNYITPFTGDFTIECWIYFNSVATQQTILGTWESPVFWELAYINGSGLRFYPNSSSNISIGGVLSTGTWYHVAVVRFGSTITTYLNGVPQTSSTFTSSIGGTSKAFGIGSEAPWTGFYFNGYLDDIRITNGIARYVQPFTPPTAALPTY